MWIGKGNVSRVISQENHQFANINPFYTTGLFLSEKNKKTRIFFMLSESIERD